MQNPFKKELELKFVKNFTSPVLGNVWIGRVATVKKDQAERFIAGGLAVLNDGKSEAIKTSGHTTVVGNPAAPKAPPADPYKGMNAAQKKAAQKAEKEAAQAKAAAEKAAKEQAEADQARLDELIGKDSLTEDEEKEMAALEENLKPAETQGQ